MEWQADFEEAVRNKLDLCVRTLTNGPARAPVCKFPAPHIEFPASGNKPRRLADCPSIQSRRPNIASFCAVAIASLPPRHPESIHQLANAG